MIIGLLIMIQLLSSPVVHQEQADASWAGRTLGRYSTIGKKGCAITSLSMLSNYLIRDYVDPVEECSYSTTPRWLDEFFDGYKRLPNQGYYGNTDNVIWNTITKYLAEFDVNFDSTADTWNPGDFYNIIKSNVAADIPVIGGVNYGYKKERPDHYVLLIGYDTDNPRQYPMHDPATKDGDYYKDAISNTIGITKRRGGYILTRLIYLVKQYGKT